MDCVCLTIHGRLSSTDRTLPHVSDAQFAAVARSSGCLEASNVGFQKGFVTLYCTRINPYSTLARAGGEYLKQASPSLVRT